jgi:hypothetical protein
MKPSQIRVFDGLRITTDHVNHLQGAFYSGLEDFREILGLGRAQVGLEVAAQGNDAISIQPGLAFDFEKNRLPVDSPQTLKLDFAALDEVKYICLKHVQVNETGVEAPTGPAAAAVYPTMIWDSSTVVVRTAAPDPKENLVVLAVVAKGADGKLHVCAEERGYRHKAMEGYKEPEAHYAPGATTTLNMPPPAVPPGAASPATPPPAAAPAVEMPSPVVPPAAVNPAVPSPEPAPPGSQPAAVPASAPVVSPIFQVRQGVAQLVSDPGANLVLKTTLAPALRQKFGAGPLALSFTLAKAGLNPDIAVAGFTTHCLLSADLTFPAAAQDTAPTHYRLQSAASGEATVGTGAVAQFGISTIETSPVPAQAGLSWPATDFTDRGLAQFAFGQWLDAPEAARPPLAAEILWALDLVVQLDSNPNGFELALKLLWNGKASEESTRSLETQEIGFTWKLIFGWKALGS